MKNYRESSITEAINSLKDSMQTLSNKIILECSSTKLDTYISFKDNTEYPIHSRQVYLTYFQPIEYFKIQKLYTLESLIIDRFIWDDRFIKNFSNKNLQFMTINGTSSTTNIFNILFENFPNMKELIWGESSNMQISDTDKLLVQPILKTITIKYHLSSHTIKNAIDNLIPSYKIKNIILKPVAY
jgi:hypothetical protein